MPLCTKVRWKFEKNMMFGLVLALLLNTIQVTEGKAKCDKTPIGHEPYKMGGDNGFSISVSGSPTLYRPGQVYTIGLEGFRAADGSIEPDRVKFIDFMLVAESDLPATEFPDLGTFRLMPGDAMSKFSHKCNHAVQATSALPKEKVEVLWTAPEAGSGCIHLRSMIVERRDVWYMDDGALTYTICEDDSPLSNSPIVEPCCACDEAKYEVIFEGLWSRHTHPNDFPVDEWQTQFSHLIGASHSIDYDLWKYGELSSPALSLLAVTGSTKKLEIDMKRHSKNIRSVIKARGLHQRSNVIGRTFAVFRMDSTNHLLSLVSKMMPSPDWIVGLSMENLCLSNCSWVDSRVIDLYPWDVGVQSGITYQDPGDETVPRESIRRITACNPDNEDSPFYDPSCTPLKPVARLHILKQREYKKQCPNGMGGSGVPLNPSWGNPSVDQINGMGNGADIYTGTGIGPAAGGQGMDNTDEYGYGGGTYNDYAPAGSGYQSSSSYSQSSSRGSSSSYSPCDVTEWSKWSPCSETCGQGSHSRKRTYKNPTGSKISNCKKNLFEKDKCESGKACPQVSYRGSYDPFFTADELGRSSSNRGYNSGWSSRGLSSDNLKKDSSSMGSGYDSTKKSYIYHGSGTNQGNVRSYVYGSDTPGNSEEDTYDSYSDPYYDPYDKLSGYAKQKGYPPKKNRPGSAMYNPYKELGYYGYTFGGYSSSSPQYSSGDDDQDSYNLVQRDEDTNNCEVTEWGDWSDCSTKCGEGTRSRSRFYTAQDTSTCSQELYQVESCHEKTDCGDNVVTNPLPTPAPRLRHKPKPKRKKVFTKNDPQCSVAQWSEWSPCSVSCGHGYSIRTRVYSLSFVPNRVCQGVRLQEKKDCRPGRCWSSNQYSDDSQDYSTTMDNSYQDTALSSGGIRVMASKQTTVRSRPSYCDEEPDPGSQACRNQITRWYYDAKDESCKIYKYSGCGGNRNSFNSEDSCMAACHHNDRDAVFKSLMPMALTREEYLRDQQINDQPASQILTTSQTSVDCQVSDWSDWSECSATCGRGWKTKTREILAEPQNGGRSCPRKLKRRKRCHLVACPADPTDWYKGNWQMLQQHYDN